MEQQQDFETLTDYLRPGLDIVFVGLNPSSYSVKVGHYFANPRNRFWAALNRSGLAPEELGPERDGELGNYGIGFTDVVKRPTPQASGLRAADYREWAPVLRQKLKHFQPRIACFHGMTGYKAYLKYGEGVDERPELGPQERTIGLSRIYVVPNPSPANAQYSLDDLVGWYRKLAEYRDEMLA
ncbi:MAG: mismatch-specific DNA-glycosylase [Chloroflexi bacterium]|nr:mismatch-specific DNA-glycosylase [Chloroflexota bacterium]